MLISYLGMFGSLRLVESGILVSCYEYVDIELVLGMVLCYIDLWCFGVMFWSLVLLEYELLCNFGLELLIDVFVGQCLFELLCGWSMVVKLFIMDNVVVVGVGNIYVSEVLFVVGIDLCKFVGSIFKVCYLCLVEEIKWILVIVIECGGIILCDFVGGDGQFGYFQQELFVYGCGGEFCKVCGSILCEICLGQCVSVYCLCC